MILTTNNIIWTWYFISCNLYQQHLWNRQNSINNIFMFTLLHCCHKKPGQSPYRYCLKATMFAIPYFASTLILIYMRVHKFIKWRLIFPAISGFSVKLTNTFHHGVGVHEIVNLQKCVKINSSQIKWLLQYIKSSINRHTQFHFKLDNENCPNPELNCKNVLPDTN